MNDQTPPELSEDQLRQAAQHWAGKMFNRTWEIEQKTERSSEEEEEMLSATLAQRALWYRVGEPLQFLIADWQVSRVAARLGMVNLAQRFAQLSLAQSHSEGIPPYFQAYAHEAVARALRLGGDRPQAAEHIDAANTLMSQIEGEEDRQRLLDDLATIGDMGVVYQLGRSAGGVPNFSFPYLDVTPAGVIGDAFEHPNAHGGPERALCLWSLEVIETIRSEGHKLGPGAAGENVTISGIDWEKVQPGWVLQIGEIRAEITRATTPCLANQDWFIDGEIKRMSDRHHPGSSRMYAQVSGEGRISVGDPVHLISGP